MPKSQERCILLVTKVKLLERLKKQLEHQNSKAIIFDMMVDIADKEYAIDKKKFELAQSIISANKNKKA